MVLQVRVSLPLAHSLLICPLTRGRLLSSIPVIGDMFVRDWIQLEETVIAEAIADLENSPKIQWITFASPDGTITHPPGLRETAAQR